jgi:hypothetical protein
MTFNGLPLHPLVLHVVVVLLPLVAAAAILVSVWPAARRKLTFLVPLGALGVLIAVPVTVAAGNDLAASLGNSPAFAQHRELGEGILPWSIAVFVLTTAQYAWFRFTTPAAQASRRWVGIVLAVLVIAAAAGSAVQVARAGDAGAHLVWEGVGTPR